MTIRRLAIGVICCCWVAAASSGDSLPVATGPGCTQAPSSYEGKYKLAEDIEFRGGFSFLRSIRQMAQPIIGPNLRKGATLNQEALEKFIRALQDKLSAASDNPFHVAIVQAFLERCSAPDGAGGELHVNLQVFDSNPSLALFRQFESRRLEAADPASAAQSDRPRSAVKFQPRAGFNTADKVYGGGLFSAAISSGLINSFTLDGTGSNKGSRVNLDLAGERTWESGYLQSATWHFGLQRADRPADEVSLLGSSIYGHLRLTSQPLGTSNTVFRFGSEIAGGNAQSGLPQAALPANTLASAANQTWKNAFGITARAGVHSVTASYGFQMGRIGKDKIVDYYKHLADVAYSNYKVFGDHKLIEFETRFTAGSLRTPGRAPVGERFFGGNRETDFFASPEFSNDWRIRSNPFLKGIAANGLDRVVNGPITGGEGFVAWNNTLTLPFPFVNYPLLPQRVVDAPDFQRGLKTQRSVNRSTLIVSYTADDPASQDAATKIPDVDTILGEALGVMNEIASSTGAGKEEAKTCASTIENRRTILAEATGAVHVVVNENDDSSVIPPVRKCIERVQGKQADQRFAPLLKALRDQTDAINALLDKIDTKKIEKVVERDMALTDRVMQVFFKEASVVSVRPIVVFDAARLTGSFPSGDQLGVRYSIGGGLRLQLLRAVNVSAGYAANPRRQPGEKPGAFFFALDFLDFFR